MSDQESTRYDVFISYAHADADTPERKAVVESIKDSIEEALKSVLPQNRGSVFLDSEALKWGDEWSTKIRKCISNCRVFVYLLSPNYLKSDYCQREKLWWARHEIDKGRLGKATCPIYYIQIPNANDDYAKENMLNQMDGEAFFDSLDNVKRDIVEDRIRNVSQGICEQVKNESAAQESYCTVYPKLSKYFVGRVKELADLNELCCDGHTIPVISGYAGIGKTELAVAYAYAYAENFPQGRFMVPMQGVHSWNDAMVKLVEQCRAYSLENKEQLPLPEDWDKLPPDEKRDMVFRILKLRSQNGILLILLDNLEDLNLISDTGLRILTGEAGLSHNLCIIATTRLNEKSPSSLSQREIYDLQPLKEKDAIELFFAMGNNIFPFAKWPFADGKLVLETIPMDKQLAEEDICVIESDYLAVKEITAILDGHAWSLEIVAGFMAENYNHYSFQQELSDLRKSALNNIRGNTHRGGSILQTAETLLSPTITKIFDLDKVLDKLGEKVYGGAIIAAFFPPENIPLYALKQVWIKAFGNELFVYDDGQKKAMTCDFAIEQLKKYRIINGEGSICKMHRLTREVLHKKFPHYSKFCLVKVMQIYWNEFFANYPNMTVLQLQPWIFWGIEWINNLSELQTDEAFLSCLYQIANECHSNNLYINAEQLLLLVLENAQKNNNHSLVVIVKNSLANLYKELNFLDKAENEYNEALVICRQLEKNQPDIYNACMTDILSNLADLHAILNQPNNAEREYAEALNICHHLRNLTKEDQDSYNITIARMLNSIAIFHSEQNQPQKAECEYNEALSIIRHIVENKDNDYTADLASVLTNIARLHHELNYFDKAEKEFTEAISIYRKLAKENPDRYDTSYALAINNLAAFHVTLSRIGEAECEYSEVLSIYNRLAEVNHNRYDSLVADTLYNIASIHDRLKRHNDAECEYTKALSIYRNLAKVNPSHYNPHIATVLNNLGILHVACNRLDLAEKEYIEALSIRRNIALNNPDKFIPDVAQTLYNLALFYEENNNMGKAEEAYIEAQNIYRSLISTKVNKFILGFVKVLNNLALFHANKNLLGDAEQECSEALSLIRSLAIDNFDCYVFDMARTLNNIAFIHAKLNYLDKALCECEEALSIYRRLADNNPERFEINVRETEKAYSILSEIRNNPNKTDMIKNILMIIKGEKTYNNQNGFYEQKLIY